MCKSVIVFILFFSLLSCNTNSLFSENQSLNKEWKKNENINFVVQITDTINRYNLFITLRNNENYKFSNLFLIVTMQFPDGKTIKDTLEYAMASPNGEWLGRGFTSIKENKLWYKEHIAFPVSGDYHFSITHAMRENGSVSGIEKLEGITDIGIKIENNNE
jgi:gliding motility-associated lipoprotein GldH